MIDVEYRHELPCSPSDYWRAAFDEPLCKRLYLRRLGYRSWALVSQGPAPEAPDMAFVRHTRGEPSPKRGIPRWVSSLAYEQVGRFSEALSRYSFSTFLASYPSVRIVGEVSVISTPAGCDRFTHVVVDAQGVPFARTVVEPLALRRLRISVDQTASFYAEVFRERARA